ncbi:MAG: AzlD domain-containing protein [Lachnospiraceae bacterium]
MVVFVVYCLRSINYTVINHWLPSVLASLLVVALHLWKKSILLSIGLGTVCYMVLVQVVFV